VATPNSAKSALALHEWCALPELDVCGGWLLEEGKQVVSKALSVADKKKTSPPSGEVLVRFPRDFRNLMKTVLSDL
jgi:hypothetical protein